MKYLVTLVVGVVVCTLMNNAVEGCTCAGEPIVCGTDFLVNAKVISLHETINQGIAVFQQERFTWREYGLTINKIYSETEAFQSARKVIQRSVCGVHLTIGQTYLLSGYVQRDWNSEDKTVLVMYLCNLAVDTASIIEADDIAANMTSKCRE